MNVRANVHGAGEGEHTANCQKRIKFKCDCGDYLFGTFKQLQNDLRHHLTHECVAVLDANARRLIGAIRRIQAMGVPEHII